MDLGAIALNNSSAAQNEISIALLKKAQDISKTEASQLIESVAVASPKNGKIDLLA